MSARSIWKFASSLNSKLAQLPELFGTKAKYSETKGVLSDMSNILLQVCWHPSGRYTLTKSVDGKLPADLSGPLFGNFNKVAFDKAKDRLVVDLVKEGHSVSLRK
jgi:hypothetical protein